MTPTNDRPKTAYLRNRPFLVITHSTRPTKGVHTERKGWMTAKGATSIEEHPEVVDRVSERKLVDASVVIDLAFDTVLRNRLNDSDADVKQHFMTRYADAIEQGKIAWMRKSLAYS